MHKFKYFISLLLLIVPMSVHAFSSTKETTAFRSIRRADQALIYCVSITNAYILKLENEKQTKYVIKEIAEAKKFNLSLMNIIEAWVRSSPNMNFNKANRILISIDELIDINTDYFKLMSSDVEFFKPLVDSCKSLNESIWQNDLNQYLTQEKLYQQ